MLVVGIVVLLVGIADFVVATVLARRSASPSGLGSPPPTPVVQILRRTGAVTVIVGLVLIVIGLFTG